MIEMVFEMMTGYLNKGGGVMYYLLASSFVFVYIGVGKYSLYNGYQKFRNKELTHVSGASNSKSPRLEWFLKEYPGLKFFNGDKATYFSREFIDEAVSYHITQLNSGLSTMAAWISIAPLLGLLGTVIGMIATFNMITLFGVGDPSLMSEGISVSLLTTQAGLTVAFPGILLLNHLQNKKKVIMDNLISDSEILINSNWGGM